MCSVEERFESLFTIGNTTGGALLNILFCSLVCTFCEIAIVEHSPNSTGFSDNCVIADSEHFLAIGSLTACLGFLQPTDGRSGHDELYLHSFYCFITYDIFVHILIHP